MLTNLEKGTDLLLRSLHFSLGWDLDLGALGLGDGRDSREFFGDGQCVCVVVNFVTFRICSEHS